MRTKAKKRKNQDVQEETRFRAADYLRKRLGTQKQAAEIFGITERSVNKIWSRYRVGGMKPKKGQVHKVRQPIREKLPEQLKLPFGLWTREAVQRSILERFGVELSRWQVGRYPKKWGYTPPQKKAHQEGLRARLYPMIKTNLLL